MKKLILTGIIAFCGAFTAFSQDASGAGPGAKTLSVDEANKLNGIAQPTINGKPYSQFKAEQDAKSNKMQKSVPQMPEQFKLPVSQTWAGKPDLIKSVTDQQVVESGVQPGGGIGNSSAKTESGLMDPSFRQSPANNTVLPIDKKSDQASLQTIVPQDINAKTGINSGDVKPENKTHVLPVAQKADNITLPTDIKIGTVPGSMEPKQVEQKTGTTPSNSANSPKTKTD